RTTERYTLSLHDALPISNGRLMCPYGASGRRSLSSTSKTRETTEREERPKTPKSARSSVTSWYGARRGLMYFCIISFQPAAAGRSEEHTSELQSPDHLVC